MKIYYSSLLYLRKRVLALQTPILSQLSPSVPSQNDWSDALSVRNRENARYTKLNPGYVMAELYEQSGTCIRTL